MKLRNLLRLVETVDNQSESLDEVKYADATEELDMISQKIASLDHTGTAISMRLERISKTAAGVSHFFKGLETDVGRTLKPEEYTMYQFDKTYLNNDYRNYQIYVYNKGDARTVKTIQKLVTVWKEASTQMDRAKQRAQQVRARVRRDDLKKEKMSGPKVTIPEDQVPGIVVARTHQGKYHITVPYNRHRTTAGTVERYAGSPAHFTKWPLKTRAAYLDMNKICANNGVEGFTVIYAVTIGHSTRFVALAANSQIVWEVDENARIDKLYIPTWGNIISSKTFIQLVGKAGNSKSLASLKTTP